MMRVAVNDFIGNRGISGSSRGSLLIQDALRHSNDVVVVSTSERTAGAKVIRLARMVYWDLFGARKSALRAGASVVVHVTNTGSASKSLPSIVVIHDTMVLDHPRHFGRGFRAYAHLMFGAAARSASIVVAPSEHSARRILERWPGTVVRVIPWPASPDKPSQILPLERRPAKVLIVASTDSHKRLDLGLAVLARLRVSTPDLIATFITRPGNAEDRFREAVNQVDSNSSWISVMSGVSEEQLAYEYSAARILMVPSLDEGFCLPVVEAAKYGTPTVHVDRGALPEVAPWPDARRGATEADDEALLFRRARLLMEDGAAWQAAHENALDIPRRFASADFVNAWQEVVEVVAGENRDIAWK